ncbi:MAG: hypothetical protein WCL50_12255 [Spirochaetota bacterium]
MAIAILFLAPATAEDRRTAPSAFSSIAFPTGLVPEQADLTLRGRIGQSGILCLDLKTIMSLPSITFRSVDPWDGKEHSFTGVSLKDFLAWAGIVDASSSLLLTAKNRYSIPIKRSDYETISYVLAWMMDGKVFSDDPATRKRGPLAIAIDFSKNKTLAMELYKHQLVWQLSDIQAQ